MTPPPKIKNYHITYKWKQISPLINFWWDLPCSHCPPNLYFFLYFTLINAIILMAISLRPLMFWNVWFPLSLLYASPSYSQAHLFAQPRGLCLSIMALKSAEEWSRHAFPICYFHTPDVFIVAFHGITRYSFTNHPSLSKHLMWKLFGLLFIELPEHRDWSYHSDSL